MAKSKQPLCRNATYSILIAHYCDSQTTDRQTKRNYIELDMNSCMHALATAAGLQDQISLKGGVGRWTVR